MDPPLNPPLFPEPTAAPPPFPTAPAANPTPTLPPVHNHRPYAEMIAAAITALNEPDGSSKQAIAKYIEAQYTGQLPSNHSALLTHHIKRLKTTGHLVMVKNSYKLSGSAPVADTNGAVNAVPSDPASSGPTKRRGRPPKPKPEFLQAAVAVPVFEPSINMNATPVFVPVAAEPPPAVSIGPVNGPGPTPTGTRRGRGRPPKQGRGAGRPPKSGGAGRGRGRPKKVATTEAGPEGPPKESGRPRGRPRKLVHVNEGVAPPVGGAETAVAPPVDGGGALPVAYGGAPVVAGKRRGRPPRAVNEAKKQKVEIMTESKKRRKSSGKPVGRPRKNALPTPAETPGSQLLMAYLDLKGKYDNLQSRIKQAANVIKPCLNNEATFNVLQELELLADGDVNQQLPVQPPQQFPAQPPQQFQVQPPQTEPPQPVMPQFQS